MGHYGVDRIIAEALGEDAWGQVSDSIATMRAKVQALQSANRAAGQCGLDARAAGGDRGGSINLTDVGQWVAFDSRQVKSVHNNGAYDPDNPDIYFVHESEGPEHQPDRHPKPGEDATGQLRQPFKTGASTSEAAQTGSTGAITSLPRDALEGKIDGASQFSLPAANVDRIEQVLGAAWDLRRRSADGAKPASAKRLRADTLLPKFDRGMSGSWSRPTRSWPTARTGSSLYSQWGSLPHWLKARFSAAADIGGAAAASKKGRCWHDDWHCQHEGSG